MREKDASHFKNIFEFLKMSSKHPSTELMNQLLFDAMYRKDIEEIKNLLSQGANVDARDVYGFIADRSQMSIPQ